MKHGLLSVALLLVALVLLAVAPPPAGAQQPGSLLIWPVNPVIEGDARAAALWLENPGKAPITLQVRIYAWTQQDGGNAYAEQDEVIGTPPIVSIEPGQRQLVRLTRTTPPPPPPPKRPIGSSSTKCRPETRRSPPAPRSAFACGIRCRFSLIPGAATAKPSRPHRRRKSPGAPVRMPGAASSKSATTGRATPG